MTPLGVFAAVVIGIYLLSSITILREYERAVIFRMGRMLAKPKGPGVILVFRPFDTMARTTLQQEALEVPPQDIITRDNVTLKVNAVITLRVVDANLAVGAATASAAAAAAARRRNWRRRAFMMPHQWIYCAR